MFYQQQWYLEVFVWLMPLYISEGGKTYNVEIQYALGSDGHVVCCPCSRFFIFFLIGSLFGSDLITWCMWSEGAGVLLFVIHHLYSVLYTYGPNLLFPIMHWIPHNAKVFKPLNCRCSPMESNKAALGRREKVREPCTAVSGTQTKVSWSNSSELVKLRFLHMHALLFINFLTPVYMYCKQTLYCVRIVVIEFPVLIDYTMQFVQYIL